MTSKSIRGGGESGSAIIVVVAVVGILGILISANSRTLANLGRELRMVEERQQKRWTNQISGAVQPPKVEKLVQP
ncbi:MAG: hypothetical protein H7X97_00880 [Opitutaceae bacterium]|nr:hypothetical protein [Verrucomicrobiales bacterium]